MKKDYIFTATMLVAFITCNILINFTTGGLNILFTVLFFVSWSLGLIGLYFILHNHVKNSKIGNIENLYNYEFELTYNYIYKYFVNNRINIDRLFYIEHPSYIYVYKRKLIDDYIEKVMDICKMIK